MRTLIALTVVMGTLSAADKDDWKTMTGTWTTQSVTIKGADQSALFKDATLTMSEGKYQFMLGATVDQGTVTIDRTKTPKHMTVTGSEGPNKGKSYECIYKFEDGTLTICYGLTEKKRPEKFESGKDSDTMLVVYKKK
jgi:uncharacterized protein (TIGR03067 family)